MESEFTKFKKQLYESYKKDMTFYGKPISPYKEWVKEVNSVTIDNITKSFLLNQIKNKKDETN